MGEIIPAAENAKSIRESLLGKSAQAQFAAALPSVGITAQRFVRMALTQFTVNPELYTCTKDSVLRALIVCAQNGFAPTGSFGAHLIPFRNGKTGMKEVVVIPDYRALVGRSWRSGRMVRLTANVVHEGDDFDFAEGDKPFLRHRAGRDADGKWIDNEDAPVTHAYALAHLRDTELPSFVVLTRKGVEFYRAKSKARNSPAWTDSWSAMACKTAIRRLCESGRLPIQDDDQRLVELLQTEDVGIDLPALEKLSPEELAAMKRPDATVTDTPPDEPAPAQDEPDLSKAPW